MFCTNNNLKEFKQIKTKLISKNKGKILDNCLRNRSNDLATYKACNPVSIPHDKNRRVIHYSLQIAPFYYLLCRNTIPHSNKKMYIGDCYPTMQFVLFDFFDIKDKKQ